MLAIAKLIASQKIMNMKLDNETQKAYMRELMQCETTDQVAEVLNRAECEA